MSNFIDFSAAVTARWESMKKHELFVTGADPDALWDSYLAAFPKGTNEIFRERTEHDGSYDRSFIKRIGNVVAITDAGVRVSLWDDLDDLPYPYNVVAEELSSIVQSYAIVSIFRSKEPTAGSKPNVEMIDGKAHTWHHFFGNIDGKFYDRNASATIGQASTDVSVIRRSFEELNQEAIADVLHLIESKALYRGDEFKSPVLAFQTARNKYVQKKTASGREAILWLNYDNRVGLIRNTAIGSLLVDLSNDVPLDDAVRSFESKVAPTNYKRTSALVTPAMVTNAMKTISSLGLEDSLSRRHAILADVSINDVLWADRKAKGVMKSDLENILLKAAKPKKTASVANSTSVSVSEFLSDVLPKAEKVELFVSNVLKGNFVSITAPTVDNANRLFQWDNGFGWSYAGNVTDSIKERVKAAGGKTDSPLRVSLAWFNGDDLDLHSSSPFGNISFRDKRGIAGTSVLDVDMNAGGATNSTDPVENQSFPSLRNGEYRFVVNNYNRRSTGNFGFEIQIEGGGVSTTLSSKTSPRDCDSVQVCEFSIKDGALINLKTDLDATKRSSEHWGIQTESFVRVQTVMLSPNHWGEQAVGNKHFFFLLEGAVNGELCRGLYNEFLRSDLVEHRKVFDLVGAKTQINPEMDASKQLSGVGFSSTIRATADFRVDGRIYSVNF